MPSSGAAVVGGVVGAGASLVGGVVGAGASLVGGVVGAGASLVGGVVSAGAPLSIVGGASMVVGAGVVGELLSLDEQPATTSTALTRPIDNNR
jgi:hypothetical protein